MMMMMMTMARNGDNDDYCEAGNDNDFGNDGNYDDVVHDDVADDDDDDDDGDDNYNIVDQDNDVLWSLAIGPGRK